YGRRAAGRSDDSGEELERGRFAGAVGAEKGHELALFQVQVDAPHRLDGAILAMKQPADRGQQAVLFLIDAVRLRERGDFDDGHAASIIGVRSTGEKALVVERFLIRYNPQPDSS